MMSLKESDQSKGSKISRIFKEPNASDFSAPAFLVIDFFVLLLISVH